MKGKQKFLGCLFTGQLANGQAVGLVFVRKFLAQNVLDRAVFCTHVRGLQVTRTLLKFELRFCAPERFDTLKFSPLTIIAVSKRHGTRGVQIKSR